MVMVTNNYRTIVQAERDWGLRKLAAAVLRQTAKDWDKGEDRSEIARFLNSDQFSLFAEMSEYDGVEYKERLLLGNYDRKAIKRPAAYRSKGVKGGAPNCFSPRCCSRDRADRLCDQLCDQQRNSQACQISTPG